MKYHPLANIFPLMQGAAFDALVADIRANGLRDPLVMREGLLLDGRNRWRAAEAAGITITDKDIKQFDPKKDGDPLAFVISMNLQRRHLDESQRAMVAAKLANMRQGERTDLPSIEGKSISQTDAAMMLNVGRASVERAKMVRRDAVPEIVKAVEQGQLAVSLAARASKLPEGGAGRPAGQPGERGPRRPSADTPRAELEDPQAWPPFRILST